MRRLRLGDVAQLAPCHVASEEEQNWGSSQTPCPPLSLSHLGCRGSGQKSAWPSGRNTGQREKAELGSRLSLRLQHQVTSEGHRLLFPHLQNERTGQDASIDTMMSRGPRGGRSPGGANRGGVAHSQGWHLGRPSEPETVWQGGSWTRSLPHVCACSVAGRQAGRQPGSTGSLSSLSLTAQLLSRAFLGVVRDKRVNSA